MAPLIFKICPSTRLDEARHGSLIRAGCCCDRSDARLDRIVAMANLHAIHDGFPAAEPKVGLTCLSARACVELRWCAPEACEIRADQRSSPSRRTRRW